MLAPSCLALPFGKARPAEGEGVDGIAALAPAFLKGDAFFKAAHKT